MKYTEEYWNDVDEVIKFIPNMLKLTNKKIFITGATGMIGSAVAEILFRLNDLYNLNIGIFLAGRDAQRVNERFSSSYFTNKYSFIKYDATKVNEININVDYIIHGASNANPKYYSEEPVETMLANIIGLNELLKVSVENGIERVLYLSSSEVYGKRNELSNICETDYGYLDILNPRACYPSSKRAAETLCSSYSSEYGIETVIARPGHIYGPTIRRSDSRASAQFTWNVVDGQNILMKSVGNQIRSYCYTLDCASAILTILINGENCEAYNIANQQSNVSILQLAQTLSEQSNSKIVFANPSDAESKGFNLMENSTLSAQKLENMGWKAIFNLDEGIRKTLQFLKG